MSIRYDDSNRQAIPRCLPYATACSLEILRINKIAEQLHGILEEDSNAIREWIEKPRLTSAIDVVAEALIVKDFSSTEARKAAKYILSKGASCSSLVRQLASHFLEVTVSTWEEISEIPDRDARGREIGILRRSVRNYPVNPIAWSDLSLSYATIGKKKKAKDAMRVAMGLSKNNRFILRSASRCFMHLKDPEKAVSILNKSGLCAIDPWIASAEIAISEATGLKSRCIGKAKDLVENDNLTSFSRSELAASLGTLEMNSGSIKRGKKIMRKAVIEPTENALAQVEWAASNFKIDFDDTVKLSNIVPASFEAMAVRKYYDKKFEESLKECKKWGRFQFLSSRPIILSMFISSCILNNDLEAINIFEDSLPAQKDSPLAMNNYAFALTRVGHTKEAAEILAQCHLDRADPEDRLAIIATTGLICFRVGNIEGGRRLYNNAVIGFEQLERFDYAAIAKYYWAVEEKRINSEDAKAKIGEAKRVIEQNNVFELEDLAKKL